MVAYALAGRVDIDLHDEPLGTGSDGEPVYLRDVWPSGQEIEKTVRASIRSEMFTKQYSEVFDGDEQWRAMEVPTGETYAWEPDSTYVKLPPYFVDMPAEPAAISDLAGGEKVYLGAADPATKQAKCWYNR